MAVVTIRRRPPRPSPKTADERDPALHEAAVRLLARREHGAGELARKLEQRGHESAAVAAEIERLASENLQSDERCAEQFVRERVGRGDGPRKIRARLSERGVGAEAVEAALVPFEDDWPALARDALVRRFGESGATGRAEQARRARFLETRGFSTGMARQAIQSQTDDGCTDYD